MSADEDMDVPEVLAKIPRRRWPRHIAVIMDGNGRWAGLRGQPRVMGHRQGAEAVQRIVEECARLQVSCLTLYAFSNENWQRPADEVEALMALYEDYLRQERPRLLAQQIRFRNIGRRSDLPQGVLREIEESERVSAEMKGMTLSLAVNYGGRQEIVDAAREVARQAAAGRLSPESIDEHVLDDMMYTKGLPDVDLIIRTAGEMRISNFLLWQSWYAELHVTQVLWPDFSASDLHLAIADYAGRRRRFGGLDKEGGPHEA